MGQPALTAWAIPINLKLKGDEMKTEDVSIKEIDVVENIRLGKNDTGIKELMESIKQHGLKQAIGVARAKNGYKLLYGYRRLLACKKLGYNTIPAVVSEANSELDHLIVNTVENIQRRDVSPYELGRICERLTKMKLTEGEIAAYLNVVTARVKKSLAVFRSAPRKMRDKIIFVHPGSESKGKISAELSYAVFNIAKENKLTQEDIENLLNYAREKELSTADIRTIAKFISAGLSISDAVKKMDDYEILRVDVTISNAELEKIQKKYKIFKRDVVVRACYGEIDPLTRPAFLKE